MSDLTNDDIRSHANHLLARAHPKNREHVMLMIPAQRVIALLDEVDHLLEMHVSLLAIRPTRGELRAENERLRAALVAITSEDGAYMACSDLPWCQGGSGPGSHHAEDCAVGIALAALASEKETK